jgi:hypothetical protein
MQNSITDIEVKVGDKVALERPYSSKYSIVTVIMVRMLRGKLQITIKETGEKFDKDGHQIIAEKGRATWGMHSQIYVLTDEIKASIEHDKLIATLKSVEWEKSTVSNDVLAEVVEHLKRVGIVK